MHSVIDPDPLNDAWESFRVHVQLSCRFEFAAPWGLCVPAGLGGVYVVTSGGCWLTAEKGVTRVALGESVIVSHATGHLLQDQQTSPTVSLAELLKSSYHEKQLAIIHGEGGERTSLAGVIFRFDDDTEASIPTPLPSVIHLENDRAENVAWHTPIVEMMAKECGEASAGRHSIVGHLLEILLLRFVRRRHVSDDREQEHSASALLHPELGPAVQMIHREPGAPWTVSSLSERTTMSRSAFSALFVEVTGKPPMQYLRDHRMQTASKMLRTPELAVKAIALQMGYHSVAAFTTAFRRWSGKSPGAYRREMLTR